MLPAPKRERAIAVWLFVMCGLIFAMVLLGGVTRLTHSGLSMVEWRPLMGVLPPMNDAAWQEVFGKYQQFPEYQKINLGMTLGEFKRIFLFEYSHRVLGRAIGVAFVLPFLYFLIRRRLNWRLAPKLAVMFVLGGLQGLLGWYMVQSGLVDRPDVSAYRLTAHLGLAVVIYAYILWVAMSLWNPQLSSGGEGRHFRIAAPILTAVIFLTILTGGFVAGNDAGLAYNSFPLMDGRFVPADIFRLEPWWRNFFENLPLVQLDHRLLALLSVIATLVLWGFSLRAPVAPGAPSPHGERWCWCSSASASPRCCYTCRFRSAPCIRPVRSSPSPWRFGPAMR